MVDVKATADPGQLKRQAKELRDVAHELDTEATRLGSGASGLTWRGGAADDYSDALRDARNKLRTQADQVRAIATAIEDGAEEITRYRARVARLLAHERHYGLTARR